MKHMALVNTELAAEHSAPVAAIAVPVAKCCVWDARGNGTGGGGSDVDW